MPHSRLGNHHALLRALPKEPFYVKDIRKALPEKLRAQLTGGTIKGLSESGLIIKIKSSKSEDRTFMWTLTEKARRLL